MAIIEIGKVPVPVNSLPTVSVGSGTNMLEMLKEVNNILNSPLIKNIIERKLGISPEQAQQTAFTGGGGTPTPVANQPPNNNSPPVETVKVDFNRMLSIMLSSPDGRKDLVDGIEQLKKFTGDVSLSKLQETIGEFKA